MPQPGRAPMARQERALATRAAILQAGARLFVRKHYDGVRIADLLAEANVTQGAFYFHFPGGKHDVAEALITLQEARFTELRDAATAPGATPVAPTAPPRAGSGHPVPADGLSALITFLRALVAEIDRDPIVRAGLRLLLEAAEHFPDIAQLPHPSWHAAIELGVRTAQRDGSLRPGLDPEVTAKALVFLFIGAQISSFVNDSWQTLAELGETLVAFITGSLAAPGYIPPRP